MEERNSRAPFIGITVEALLRPCEIYPIASQAGHGYLWEWSSVGDEVKSRRPYDMFFDCLEDARQNGYEPHFLDRSQELTVVPVKAAA